MTETLPQLLDCRALMAELGIKQSAALAIMRQLPKVEPKGVRKVYVKREDVERFLDDSTRAA